MCQVAPAQPLGPPGPSASIWGSLPVSFGFGPPPQSAGSPRNRKSPAFFSLPPFITALDADAGSRNAGELPAIRLAPGIYTAFVEDWYPEHRAIMNVIDRHLSGRYSDRRVLDLGCLEGYFSLECALHGAVATQDGVPARRAGLRAVGGRGRHVVD